jgi:hypothetical protein
MVTKKKRLPGDPAEAGASNVLQLPTVTVRPTGAPAPAAGMALAGNPVAGMNPLNRIVQPAATVPGTAAPDVNPLPLGTRVGSALRTQGQDAINGAVGGINRLSRLKTNVSNALTLPSRATFGFVADVGNALAGNQPRADVGHPLAGDTAPQLPMPFVKPPVNFQTAADPVAPPGAKPARPVAATLDRDHNPQADNISMGNLATANRMTVPDNGAPRPNFADVRSSVSTARIKQPGLDSGVDIGGRHVNAGAMVDGVPTFSDGTGGIPATMSPAAIADLAQERSISRADRGAAGNVLASDTMGGSTPTQEQMVAQRMAQIRQPITGSRPTAAQFAAADRNAIAMRDPRSAAGRAARNLSVESEFARTPRSRAAAAAQLAQLSAGTDQANLQGLQDAGAMARTDATNAATLENTALQGQNTLANTTLAGQNTLANTKLENTIRKPGTQFADDKGNLWLPDSRGGAATPVVGPDGKQLKQTVTRDDSVTKRTQEIQDNLGKGVQALLTEYNKSQAFLPADQQQPATPAMLQQWKEQQAAALGLRVGTNDKKQRVALINGQEIVL